jgi:hypothetical protein
MLALLSKVAERLNFFWRLIGVEVSSARSSRI